MRRCPGTPYAVGVRGYRPNEQGTPVRAVERHRRLPADVPSALPAVILGMVDGLQLQRVEGAAESLQPLQGHAKILCGGSDIGMPKQRLDGTYIGAAIEHVGGAGMPEQVRINPARN